MPPGGWAGARLAENCFSRAIPVRGEELARELCSLNRERQAIEAEILRGMQALAETARPGSGHALVLAGEGGTRGWWASWPPVWRRVLLPAFMICLQDGQGKGSCRSFGGFNLFAALERAPPAGGIRRTRPGGGFTIREEKIIRPFAAA